MNICYTLLFFSILFFFSRVVRLFRANQQKKASLSLVKITEEFKMQVVRQEKYKLKYRHWNSFFISETLACEILRSDFKLSFPFFLPLLPRPQHPPPPPKKKKTSELARRVESPGLFNRQHLTTLKVLSKVSCRLCFTLIITWLSYK